MDKNNYKEKSMSFWQLLKCQNIEIPIIQRDYAQGREDKEELRNNFFNALYLSLNENKPIKLDFIYGSKERGSYQPLDGQQRLTTLFLLHWYSAIKENRLIEDNIAILSRFSYETRASSREFCSALVNNIILFDESKEKISELIIDSPWFFLSWKKDPTIDAMLRAIDDIHKRFRDIENLWLKLTSDDVLIGFYYIELEDIGLTDDLYIKMNARGKLLTPFENFKAIFQKFIHDNRWELNVGFTDSFACKVDTQWTDLFWKHRKNNQIDESFMRFIAATAMIQQVVEKSNDRFNNIFKLQNNPEVVRVEYFTEKGFHYLCKCLDIYSKILEDQLPIELNFPLWQHKPEKNIFSALVYESSNASYTQKVLFYAQTEYLIKVQEFNKENFLCWMRVIRNVISRGDVTKAGDRPAIIRSPQTFDGVINLIHELAEGCEDIYSFLAVKNTIVSSFAKEQIEEERLKARLIASNPEYKGEVFSIEDTNLFQGRIDFAFYCINFDKNKSIENFDIELLSRIKNIIKKYFDKDITNDVRRALLTISNEGQYKYYDYWWSYSYIVDANKRCLIDKYRELEYYIYGSYKNKDCKEYLKNLILALTKKDLVNIISDFTPPLDMPNWKVRLIKEPELLNVSCKSHYIAIPEDESCCYLLRSVRPRDIDACFKIV